ncbi:MAG TPA: glycosyltransferase family 39 protein, partial [Patescibacteria group bacterium]|nr:glycosyltransferase family 39 protein [Patescibacteria group bacterium]
MRTTTTDRYWPWALAGSLAVYCLWAGLLILQNPGFQYDEALLVLGAVHMRNAPGELALPHDPNTWFCPSGHCFPLLTVRYVGAIKEYLCLPLFAAFGPSAEGVRIVSMLLGMLGLYGIAILIAGQVSPAAAAITACMIAVNPAYADLTVFDNGTVAIWMGALGVLCLAISHYLRRQNVLAAFWLGMAVGFGVWARANFVWLLGALFAAALLVLGRRLRQPLSHWAAAALGGLVGGAPFFLYQVVSRGGTWEAIGMFSTRESLGQRLSTRLIMFSETLLSDREHRAIWGGPPLPDWQRWLFPAVVLGACL